MFCSNCGSENQNNAQYCSKCGQKLIFNEKISKINSNSALKEKQFSLDSVHWVLVIPIAIVIAVLVSKADSGSTAFLILVIGLAIVGFLVKDLKIGALNGCLTGALAFFIGSAFGSLSSQGFGPIIGMTIIGALAGMVFGGLGGYIKKISGT